MNSFYSYADEQLILLLRESKNAAAPSGNTHKVFDEIYHRYWKRLFAAALNQLEDPFEAEELVQDIFVDIWNRRHKLEIKSSLNAYLHGSVNYKVINALARRAREKRRQESLAVVFNATHNPVEEEVRVNELKQRLSLLVRSLPEKCRMVFELSRNSGLTRKEIARNLDISEKTVEAHLTRALTALRNSLGALFTILLLLVKF